MTEPCPNHLPIGRLRLWLHEHFVQAANQHHMHEVQAYAKALDRCVLAEGEQQQRDIDVNECLDRCQSALAQQPDYADLVLEIGNILDGRTRHGA